MDDNATLRVRKLVAQVAIAAAVWAALLLVGALWWLGGSLREIAANVPAILWVATLVAFAANHLLRFARWHWMLVAEGYRVPAMKSLGIFMAGIALVPTPAKAGVAVRSLLLLRHGVPVNVTLAMYFTERLFDLLGLIALAALILASTLEQRWFFALAGGLAAVVAVRLAPRIARAIHGRLGPGRLKAVMAWSIHFVDHSAELVAGRLFVPFFALGLLANVCTGLLLWLALSRFGSPVAMPDAIGVLGVSHLSGSLSLLPGGLGGFELAMLGQLSLLSVGAATALVTLALVRLVTVWLGVAVGLPLLAYYLRQRSGGAIHTTSGER